MPSPFPNLPPEARGSVVALRHRSSALQANFWNDPAERDVHVYTPPGYRGQRLPAVLFLAGYAGNGEKFLARGLTEVSIASRLDRLIASGMRPFLAVLPDVMTTLGGSQYVDSPAIGNYTTWLADELPPFVEQAFPCTGRWGVVGKSSGGFGALHLALERPGRFRAVACHSADMGFDLCYLADIPAAVRGVSAAGGLGRFVSAFWAKDDPGGGDFAALNLLCMACAYSPDPARRPIPARLPVDFDTGAVDFDVLRAWSRFDPVVRDLEPLRHLEALSFDCGNRDEHLLHFGARRLAGRLRQANIAFDYDEFPAGHRGTSYRYDVSLPRLAAVLSPS